MELGVKVKKRSLLAVTDDEIVLAIKMHTSKCISWIIYRSGMPHERSKIVLLQHCAMSDVYRSKAQWTVRSNAQSLPDLMFRRILRAEISHLGMLSRGHVRLFWRAPEVMIKKQRSEKSA